LFTRTISGELLVMRNRAVCHAGTKRRPGGEDPLTATRYRKTSCRRQDAIDTRRDSQRRNASGLLQTPGGTCSQRTLGLARAVPRGSPY
jgi:hypothetical protein